MINLLLNVTIQVQGGKAKIARGIRKICMHICLDVLSLTLCEVFVCTRTQYDGGGSIERQALHKVVY